MGCGSVDDSFLLLHIHDSDINKDMIYRQYLFENAENLQIYKNTFTGCTVAHTHARTHIHIHTHTDKMMTKYRVQQRVMIRQLEILVYKNKRLMSKRGRRALNRSKNVILRDLLKIMQIIRMDDEALLCSVLNSVFVIR